MWKQKHEPMKATEEEHVIILQLDKSQDADPDEIRVYQEAVPKGVCSSSLKNTA